MSSPDSRTDSDAYLKKKAFLQKVLTLYGRKAVLEALQSADTQPHKLHLSARNKPAQILSDITHHARKRAVEVETHTPEALARISKNARQDQGVALDVICPRFDGLNHFLNTLAGSANVLLLDGVTNPQNLGMIIRSVAASGIDGLIITKQGTSSLGPLVIKASSGAIFKAPILHADSISSALHLLGKAGFTRYSLEGDAQDTLFSTPLAARAAYVLGNETHGVSEQTQKQVDRRLRIPMANGVESLNVAVAASLVAYACTHT